MYGAIPGAPGKGLRRRERKKPFAIRNITLENFGELSSGIARALLSAIQVDKRQASSRIDGSFVKTQSVIVRFSEGEL